MAKRVQRRRGTTVEHTTFTGADGEVTVDSTKDTAVVHDGSQVGGYPLAREDMSNVTNKIGVTELNLSEGTAGQVIKTDGAGTISFTTVVTDPTMGGDLTGTTSNAQIAANTVGITELNVSDGSANQVLKTDGSGTLSFSSISSDPTMGGDLTGTASNAQIAANAVTATEIETNAVTTVKITDLNVTTAKIADLNITTGKIAANAVTTAKIADLNITTGKIAANAVTESKITAQTITNASIYPGTIRSQEIENGTITGTDIADNSISGSQIALGGDTQGDTMHYDGTNWARLGPGTSGWLLKTNGANANPSWVSPISAGLPATGIDGNVLTSDGTSWASEAPIGGVGGELVSMQSFTQGGEGSVQTWTRPSGVTRIRVCIVGGGGVSQGANSQYVGAGGGGGYCESIFDVSSISTASIVIGTGGAQTPPALSSSTFTATGITTMTAVGGGARPATITNGGTGGVATGGQLNLTGEAGQNATTASGVEADGGAGAGPFGSRYGHGGWGHDANSGTNVGSPGICLIYEYSDASANLVGEKLVSHQFFTGSGTWTKPAGVTKIRVYVQGAGGSSTESASSGAAPGGGGGGCAIAIRDVTSVTSLNYTAVSFDTGGLTGTAMGGGNGGNATANGGVGGAAAGGAGGIGTGGDINLTGALGGQVPGPADGGHGAGPFGSFSVGGAAIMRQTTDAGGGGCVYIEEYSDPSLVSGRLGNTFSTNASNKIQHLYLGIVTGALTGTWTKPTGVTHIHVQVLAGGQAGGQDFAGDPPAAGSQGSSGGYSENIIDVSNITSLDWVAGGSSTAAASNWGGHTYFGSNGTLHASPTIATLTVTVVSGVITAIANPSDLGSGMTIPPIIVIEPNATSATGRGGAGAVATAQISGGSITGITVTNGGTGYVSGEVQAYFGVGAVRGSGFGSSGNLGAAKSTSTYLSGQGGGGAGEPSGGGAAGAGGWGGIYIKEYR